MSRAGLSLAGRAVLSVLQKTAVRRGLYRFGLGLSMAFWLFGCAGVTAAAASLSLYTKYSGVSLSPDGQAFTTDAGVKTYERYPAGYTVYTGEKAASSPAVGEHAYVETNPGEVRILKWVVTWGNGRCIHPYYLSGYYHGIQYTNVICWKDYAQGWTAYCADCGEPLTNLYMYMNSSTARGIRSLPGNAEYYYLCPWCGGLEQGAGYSHTCKRISANRYTVSYDANAPSGARVTGSMAATGHMYGNASLYEGSSAAAAGYGSTSLRANVYACEGYLFAGWNTRADGSGASYADGAAVLNLTNVNGGSVKLYAQWVKAETEPEGENPDPGSGTAPDPGSGTDSDPGSGTAPDPGSGTAPDPGSGTDPDPESGTDPDPEEEPALEGGDGTDSSDEKEKLVLTAWIEHSRDGYSGDFKSGEGGILYICVQEYAERIEVVFPEEFTTVFPQLNKTFVYEDPLLTQEESISFSVPLYTPPGVYQITVRAYRGEEEAEALPVLVVLEESVLDELRTRIRNNQ